MVGTHLTEEARLQMLLDYDWLRDQSVHVVDKIWRKMDASRSYKHPVKARRVVATYYEITPCALTRAMRASDVRVKNLMRLLV